MKWPVTHNASGAASAITCEGSTRATAGRHVGGAQALSVGPCGGGCWQAPQDVSQRAQPWRGRGATASQPLWDRRSARTSEAVRSSAGPRTAARARRHLRHLRQCPCWGSVGRWGGLTGARRNGRGSGIRGIPKKNHQSRAIVQLEERGANRSWQQLQCDAKVGGSRPPSPTSLCPTCGTPPFHPTAAWQRLLPSLDGGSCSSSLLSSSSGAAPSAGASVSASARVSAAGDCATSAAVTASTPALLFVSRSCW